MLRLCVYGVFMCFWSVMLYHGCARCSMILHDAHVFDVFTLFNGFHYCVLCRVACNWLSVWLDFWCVACDCFKSWMIRLLCVLLCMGDGDLLYNAVIRLYACLIVWLLSLTSDLSKRKTRVVMITGIFALYKANTIATAFGRHHQGSRQPSATRHPVWFPSYWL